MHEPPLCRTIPTESDSGSASKTNAEVNRGSVLLHARLQRLLVRCDAAVRLRTPLLIATEGSLRGQHIACNALHS
eukprot:236794-Chlamydomonas_euryale.AAC.5